MGGLEDGFDQQGECAEDDDDSIKGEDVGDSYCEAENHGQYAEPAKFC